MSRIYLRTASIGLGLCLKDDEEKVKKVAFYVGSVYYFCLSLHVLLLVELVSSCPSLSGT